MTPIRFLTVLLAFCVSVPAIAQEETPSMLDLVIDRHQRNLDRIHTASFIVRSKVKVRDMYERVTNSEIHIKGNNIYHMSFTYSNVDDRNLVTYYVALEDKLLYKTSSSSNSIHVYGPKGIKQSSFMLLNILSFANSTGITGDSIKSLIVSNKEFVDITQEGYIYTLSLQKEGRNTRCTFDENQGYSLTKTTFEANSHGKIYFSTKEMAYQQDESGLWFPSEMKYSTTADGELLMRSSHTVEHAVLNPKLDDSMFTLDRIITPYISHVIDRRSNPSVTMRLRDYKESLLDSPDADSN